MEPHDDTAPEGTSRAQLVARIAGHFMSLGPDQFDAGIDEALRAVGEFSDVDRCYLFRVDPGDVLSNTHEWCADGIDPEIHNLQEFPGKRFPWFMERISAGEVVHAPCVAELPSEAEAERREWLREGIQSLICVPLETAGRVVGFLGLDCVRRRHSWSERAVELLRSVGGIVLGAINQRLASRELRESVTEKREAEEARQRLSTAIEQVADAVTITTAEGVIRYVNPAFERLTGHHRAALIGRDRRFLRHEEQDAEEFLEIAETVNRGRVWTGRVPVRRRDGSAILMDTTVSPVADSNGLILQHVVVQRDVTREAALEEQLRQGQKMEAVGMLAGGIAHDFNNLLIAIIGHSDLLLMRRGDDEEVRRHVEEISKAGERAKALTSQLLAFSRKQVLRPRTLDLGGVIRDLADLLRRVIGEDVELIVQEPQEPTLVEADPGQMQQVVVNLATNARDAMPAGGTLEIAVEHSVPTPEEAERVEGLEARPYAVLTVRDSGLGMDEDTRARIFEPFFTTKAVGQGMGLGLATVYGIVHQSGGTIHVESEVDAGSAFRVFLPIVQASTDVPPPRAPEPEPQSGSEIILVVEDDSAVAGIVCNTLRSQGYGVLYAENGRHALEVLGEHRGQIDLLFTDVVMPEMGGVQLAATLTAERPDLRVLFSSGYTDSALMQRGALVDGVQLLQKPFSPAVLAQRVRSVLDAPPG